LKEKKNSTIRFNLSDQKIKEVVGYYALVDSRKETCKAFQLTDETLGRYLREAKARGFYTVRGKALQEISKKFSDQELYAISKGGRLMPGKYEVPIIDFNGIYAKWGAITDTHFGSIYFNSKLLYKAYEEMEKQKVDFITHSGDVTEGMSNRPGQIYELNKLGYDEQRQYAVKLLDRRPVEKLYMIDGNHDRWFQMSNGALIVPDIAKETGAIFLGHDEGDLSIGGATIKLWHGLDGNSYAHSYRLQKLVESFTGGEKPNILLAGHVHKSIYIMDRHVHCYSVGAIQKQTKWMRGKKIPSHTGFWIIEAWFNDRGVATTRGQWYPFYQ